ncbi:M48 family metallopeptidase [Uruburuella testudinis]|uniref:M48 family metallopeptidase n=1 Tax=Uruburuella testudinis TaxID=1282863 RepID=A0ABY4DV47_9NEIS|nr:M48 family metallopeptidase [Uruburuella testudinis]UOO82589.1 M48 family metallopeptidase [Uruburuella testudinis]
MKFENHRFDERLNPNIAHEHPLKELGRMVMWLAAAGLAILLAVELLVRTLPYTVSLQNESRWFSPLAAPLLADIREDAGMQALADKIAASMQMPQGSVTVHIGNDEMVNAFATFGGHVVMMQGLLDVLPSEEAVAAVLAHEIGHIRARDPLRGVSRSLLLDIIGSAVLGGDGFSSLGYLENLRYSRDLEEAADAGAVRFSAAEYGHTGGVVEMLEVLAELSAQQQMPAHTPDWLSTHPRPQARLAAVRKLARQAAYAEHKPARPNRWQRPSE